MGSSAKNAPRDASNKNQRPQSGETAIIWGFRGRDVGVEMTLPEEAEREGENGTGNCIHTCSKGGPSSNLTTKKKKEKRKIESQRIEVVTSPKGRKGKYVGGPRRIAVHGTICVLEKPLKWQRGVLRAPFSVPQQKPKS